MITIEKILESAQAKSATDVHLMAGVPPKARIDGTIYNLDYPKLLSENIEKMIDAILPEQQRNTYGKKENAVFTFSIANRGRYRANVYRAAGNINCSIRILSEKIPDISELQLEDIYHQMKVKPGITIVSGKAGSGKTTALASLMNGWNESRKIHIMTVENPIEYKYQQAEAMIHQKEVGIDVLSATEAILQAVREDVDVLIVRTKVDADIINAMITAAQAGICVYAEMNGGDETTVKENIGLLLDEYMGSNAAITRKKQFDSLLHGIIMVSKGNTTYCI